MYFVHNSQLYMWCLNMRTITSFWTKGTISVLNVQYVRIWVEITKNIIHKICGNITFVLMAPMYYVADISWSEHASPTH